MKVGAHPLVVAVALGFLGPQALAEDTRRGERTCAVDDEPAPAPCAGCDCGAADLDAADDALIADAFEALTR